MSVLLEVHPAFLAHDTGPGHPERPARLSAIAAGIERAGVADAVVEVAARPATRAELERVHPGDYVDALERFCASGGGHLDADTAAAPASWEAALRAAGAGLDAVERLDRGEADAAFCVVRPPGHHATRAPLRPGVGLGPHAPEEAGVGAPPGAPKAPATLGFCLFNNVAVAAAALADRGERVLVLDWDAHHGDGTQDVFYDDPRVLYVSLHQFPLYPGTGRLTETGAGDGLGSTINLPLPAGATGDSYLDAMDRVVAPAAESFGVTWLLVSAGFDAHRADPLTGLGLSAGDFADLTTRALALAPPGRRVLFLEGGYDLDALASSAGATVASLLGAPWRPEPATANGPGREVADAALRLRDGADA